MAAVRDSLCNMEPVHIPRPHVSGLQFIPTKGRLGFYRSIRRDGEKYGVEIKPTGPRRPLLSEALFIRDGNVTEQPSAGASNIPPDDQVEITPNAINISNQNTMSTKEQKSENMSGTSFSKSDYDISNSETL